MPIKGHSCAIARQPRTPPHRTTSQTHQPSEDEANQGRPEETDNEYPPICMLCAGRTPTPNPPNEKTGSNRQAATMTNTGLNSRSDIPASQTKQTQPHATTSQPSYQRHSPMAPGCGSQMAKWVLGKLRRGKIDTGHREIPVATLGPSLIREFSKYSAHFSSRYLTGVPRQTQAAELPKKARHSPPDASAELERL